MPSIEKELDKMIDLLHKESSEKQHNAEAEYQTHIDSFNKLILLITKFKNHKKFSKEELKEIQCVLCYGNIGYCCGLEKKCLQRDAVRHILNISDTDFKKKEQWIDGILGTGS
jgi:predicted metal-binding transcription factor (methanogenesis marker protein 9)